MSEPKHPSFEKPPSFTAPPVTPEELFDAIVKQRGIADDDVFNRLLVVRAINELTGGKLSAALDALQQLPPARPAVGASASTDPGASDVREKLWRLISAARNADEIELGLYPAKRQERIRELEAEIAELRGEPVAEIAAERPKTLPGAGPSGPKRPTDAAITPRDCDVIEPERLYIGPPPRAPGDPPPRRPPVVIEGEVLLTRRPASPGEQAAAPRQAAEPSTPYDPIVNGLQRDPETAEEKAERDAALARANAPVDERVTDTRPRDPASEWARGNGGWPEFGGRAFRREW